MKTLALAAALTVVALSAPAFAQDAPKNPAAAAPAVGKISVETTPISEILKNPAAKAVLEKMLPDIPQYYPMISELTLSAVAPQSRGQLDDAKLKELQAEFDKLN